MLLKQNVFISTTKKALTQLNELNAVCELVQPTIALVEKGRKEARQTYTYLKDTDPELTENKIVELSKLEASNQIMIKKINSRLDAKLNYLLTKFGSLDDLEADTIKRFVKKFGITLSDTGVALIQGSFLSVKNQLTKDGIFTADRKPSSIAVLKIVFSMAVENGLIDRHDRQECKDKVQQAIIKEANSDAMLIRAKEIRQTDRYTDLYTAMRRQADGDKLTEMLKAIDDEINKPEQPEPGQPATAEQNEEKKAKDKAKRHADFEQWKANKANAEQPATAQA